MHKTRELAAAHEEGTEPEDFAVYLETLEEYYGAAVGETPAEYLGRLAKLTAETERVLPALRRYAALPEHDFVELYAGWDEQVRIVGEYFIAVRSAVDAMKWLAAREQLARRPRFYAHALQLLGDAGVLPAGTLPALLRMIRARNTFIHHLDNPSAGEMHGYLQDSVAAILSLIAILRDRYLDG